MYTENIVGFVIYLFVACFMVVIGISQLKSKKPVGFYSGELPPKAEELSDVAAWNRKHGMMWLIYGIVVICSYFVGIIIGDSLWSVIPMCLGVIIPIPIMIYYHNRLQKIYLRK